ncbi:hypothetical protein Dimus_022939 [Dionaea muscipula]
MQFCYINALKTTIRFRLVIPSMCTSAPEITLLSSPRRGNFDRPRPRPDQTQTQTQPRQKTPTNPLNALSFIQLKHIGTSNPGLINPIHTLCCTLANLSLSLGYKSLVLQRKRKMTIKV